MSGTNRRWQRWDPNKEAWFEIDNTKDVCVSGDVILYVNNNSEDAVITFSGAVKDLSAKPEYTIYGEGCAQFIAYPWPVAIKVSDVASYIIDGTLKAAAQFDGCDQIWRYDAVGDKWVKYAYHRVNGTTRTWQKYIPADGTWANLDDEKDVIGPGEGFLFVNNDSNDKTFKFTYAK